MRLKSYKLVALRFYFVLICAFLLISACDQKKEVADNVLAQINDLTVTESHLKSAFQRYYYKSGQSLKPSFSTKSNILDAEFNNYVMAVFAQDKGLDKTEEAQKMHDMIRRRVLNQEYLDQVILEGISATEAETREIFVKFNTTLRASHLYASTKEEADILYTELQEGKSFNELAKSVFQNPKLAESGGDLGEFTVDEMDVAFERAAYQLKAGEISKPVRTAQGYSIIRLTDKFTNPILTEYQFASKKNQFAFFAEEQKRELATRNHLYDFTDGLEIKEPVFDEMWEAVSSNYSSFVAGSQERFTSPENEEKILAEYNNYILTVADFYEEAFLTPAKNLNNIKDKSSFLNFVKGIAYRSYLYQHAQKEGLNERGEIQASINQTYYLYLADLANEYLKKEIEFTDLELRKAYDKEQERFEKPLEINLARIVVADEIKADEVMALLEKGVSFEALVEKYTINNEERLLKGELGFDYISSYGFLSPKLSELKTGDVSDPLFYQSGVYHIYKCLGRKEARQLSFKEARQMVKDYLQKEKLEEVRGRTIQEVKASHGAVVDKEKLRKLTIQI